MILDLRSVTRCVVQHLKPSNVSKEERSLIRTYNVWLILTKVDINASLKLKFSSLISNLLNVSSVPLSFHVIVDDASENVAQNYFINVSTNLKYELKYKFYNIKEVSRSMQDIVTILMPHFSLQPGNYYSDALFYVSLGLYRIAPNDQEFAVMLDCDLFLKDDIVLLFNEFQSFKPTALFGLAPELTPVYRHVLNKYRSKHNTTLGSYYDFNYLPNQLHPRGFQGYNSGVILFNFKKIRKSKIYFKVLSKKYVKHLVQKYMFRGHLGDQDFYTLLGCEHPELIQTLNCGFNRQLCTWWKHHGYIDVFDDYFKCKHKTVIVHDMSDEERKTPTKSNTKYIILNKSTIQNQRSHADISRKLLCIEYPGIVDNIDTMMETLGGIHNIETAVGNYNRRLELKFRPDDIFCKPTWGDKDYSCRILVKINMRTPRKQKASVSKSDEQDQPTFKYELIGLIPMTFKFTRLCDFQYLPLLPIDDSEPENPNTACRNIYEDIIPETLPDMKWFESMKSKTMPFFFPPPVFAKFNSSKDNRLYYERYKYYEKVLPEVAKRLKKETFGKKQVTKNIISSRPRSFRTVNSIFINFNAKDVTIPQCPTEAAVNAIKRKGVLTESGPMAKIKKLFEERPIWAKSALLHKSGVRTDHIKVILPVVAYYCSTGPWRIMWCKLGYDPTKDPNSRIYQTFDFRVRASGGLKVKVQAKRSYSSNVLHYKAGPTTNQKFSLNHCSVTNPVTKQRIDERFYILRPGMLPAARQMFYQYCDLELPEIQDMIARLPKITKHLKYHPKNGWLPNGFHEQCREISNKYVAESVKSLLMEDKQRYKEKTKEDGEASSKYSNPIPKPDVTILGATIVIDSDNEDDDATKNPDEDVHSDDEPGEDDHGNVSTDTDEEGRDELDDIDLEAVEEINKIIGNTGESEASTRNDIENRDSDDEFDPDLINLYKKLILSNSESNL
ncbi:hypothetical protein RN001_008019 [Aquatica leii]|uniref:General transcription factor 3C polypeptide 5 n=1 Tax=Aquatica leii TaxID=1421715 RepID=A0AAN7QIR7_9COLE|nr:hypothetical protein RN001_008019 [Aquatica leii]